MAFYKQRGFRQLTSEISHEGVGIGGGFIVGGVVGRQVETMLMKDSVTEFSPITDKVMAWAANNGSKAVLYYLAKKYDARSTMGESATSALAGSIVYDTILRLAGRGVNTADVNLAGYRILGQNKIANANVQKLVQENSILRTELNKALQKLATQSQQIQAPRPAIKDMPLRVPGFGTIPDPAERQARYGFSGPVGGVQSTGQYPGIAPGLPPGKVPVPLPGETTSSLPGITPREVGRGPGVPGSPMYTEAGPQEKRFGSMPFNPEDMKVQQKYGSMPFAPKTPTQRKFGSMGFMGEIDDASRASVFGMQ